MVQKVFFTQAAMKTEGPSLTVLGSGVLWGELGGGGLRVELTKLGDFS